MNCHWICLKLTLGICCCSAFGIVSIFTELNGYRHQNSDAIFSSLNYYNITPTPLPTFCFTLPISLIPGIFVGCGRHAVDVWVLDMRAFVKSQNNSQRIRLYKTKMSSALFDEETTSEHRDIGKKVLTHLKSFYFFIYYQLGHLSGEGKKMNLEKISFKLKDDKNQYSQKYGDYNKNVQLSFHDIENENEVSSSLHDLKVTSQESKIKLIFLSSEALMVNFYLKAKNSNIGIEGIPMCIYTSGIHCDFSKFLGWGEPGINNLSALSVNEIERDVRKWVESPAEKIDIWSVEMKVSQQGGSIQKLNDINGFMDKFKSSCHRELFISNLSVGYHPHLLLDYEQRKTSKQSSFFNRLVYSFQGLKKFCCVGNHDMREATGIVKIDYVDEKGEHQILKYLRDPQGDQDSQYIPKNKPANRKKVLSIVLSNIDRFFGQKIKDNENSRMNDQKLELITFQSEKEATKISSVSGQINMQFSPDQPVYVQINDSCYRLEKPLALKVENFGKAKIIINKETLSC